MKIPLLLLLVLSSLHVNGQVLTGDSTLNAILTDIEYFENQRFSDDERAKYPLGINTEASFTEQDVFNRSILTRLDAMDPSALTFDDYISHQLLRFTINNQIELFKYQEYLIPILSESGFHTQIMWRTRSRLGNTEQAANYLAYLEDIPRYFEENFALMRKGIELGITQPLPGLQNYGATYQPYIVDDPSTSIFFKPFLTKPSGIPTEEWNILVEQAITTINQVVTPAYKKVKAFFEEEYFPNTRPLPGAYSLPDGKAYYTHKVKYYITDDLSPDEVFEIGMEEVRRIRSEMEEVIADVGFKGSFAEFVDFLRTDEQFYPKTPEELLKEASYIAKKVDGNLPALFGLLPRQPYGVVPVPAYLAENYTSGRYSGAPLSSKRGGQYWVNTTKLNSRTLYTLEALTLHEAMPGHHLQIALTAELENLPSFRRNMYINAFGEGWGLYAEFLGYELGLYQDPYSEFGRLTYEMWRASRLVIDTGIHFKGWSRDEAVEFLASNTALSLHEVNTEINRYITWPGQALAYKMGEITIKKLRKKAATELGDDFDVREFHDVVLSKGTVTMSILEEIVVRWMDEKKAETDSAN